MLYGEFNETRLESDGELKRKLLQVKDSSIAESNTA